MGKKIFICFRKERSWVNEIEEIEAAFFDEQKAKDFCDENNNRDDTLCHFDFTAVEIK